ncbi:MAG TPA: biotin carboxylase N-terminal domain-containing protein [Vicinamibacterales bacterium]|nr:biotin carboxylase N-terminal domain-containing protein [Vicinamibacterales bacterium]
MIGRILVANRGEIAVRIIRACREAGVESVAVFSDADASARHVALADSAVRIGAAPARDSYLNIAAIVDAARAAQADAVHPGYGFLSERAAFADACASAGLTFVGPPADVIERMGSKIAARETMRAAGVPVVPGETPADQSEDGVCAALRRVGVPALIKASAGGGGKGMRTVIDEARAREAIAAARRESQNAFGDGTLYVERLIEEPRHVEVQICGDARGNVVHLLERECSLQRRHQKVIEESPSPALTPAVRARLCEAAVAAARAVRYQNAGTVEFLLEGHGDTAQFYFLEMNTRLQVEHPVTEAIAGVDIVRAQLAIAGGAPVPWTQDAISARGHAFECRVYAEDPSRGFLPQAGPLVLYREPSGPGVRVDSGVAEGDVIGVDYDPMIAKVTVHAETREFARRRALTALRGFPVLGVRTNIAFLIALLEHPAFVGCEVDTGFIDRHLQELVRRPPPPPEALAVAAAVDAPQARVAAGAPLAAADPWTDLRGWGR